MGLMMSEKTFMNTDVDTVVQLLRRVHVQRFSWGQVFFDLASTARSVLKKYLVKLAWLLFFMPGIAFAQPAAHALIDPATQEKISALAMQLARLCPLADAADQQAFDQCRQRLFLDTKLRQSLATYTLWGRRKDPDLSLKENRLTQLGVDVVSGLYLPLFMFDGTYTTAFNEREKMVQVNLGIAFRNRLQPGQFPYPFWHEPEKWKHYEHANILQLWIAPSSGKIRAIQFSVPAWNSDENTGARKPHTTAAIQPVDPPQFDGQWVWTDVQGKVQPAVTLFDGLFHANNPYKEALAQSYRTLALTLRDGQCLQCHVPNNPNGMSRLVLLQSPAHAAAEITRILKEVRNNTMPVDEFGLETSLDPNMKALLLQRGSEFERVVEMARAWEKQVNQAQQ